MATAAIASRTMFDCAVVEEQSCATSAPGLVEGSGWSLKVQACAEVVRILLVWLAFALLGCGYAHGGRGEILALERVRQDGADGELDGERDIVRLRAQDTDIEEDERDYLDDEEIDAAVTRERLQLGVARRTGHCLPWFLLYDVLVCVYLVCDMVTTVVWRAGRPDAVAFGWPDSTIGQRPAESAFDMAKLWSDNVRLHWKFWTAFYFAKNTYACAALPFLLFSIPLLGPALHKAKPTGYDMHGLLCAKLGASDQYKIYLARLAKAEQANSEANGEAKFEANGEREADGKAAWEREQGL